MLESSNKSSIEAIEIGTVPLLEIFEKWKQNPKLKSPEDGKWSFEEILEHILLVETRLMSIIRLPKNDESVISEQIRLVEDSKFKYILIDKMDEAKVDAPEMVKPKGIIDRESINEHFEKILKNRNDLIQLLAEGTTSLVPMVVEHGRFGKMTKQDWISFNMFHSQRHIIQMDRLFLE